MKQYTIEAAYTYNSKIKLYNDGKLLLYEIISNYNLNGYCEAIENQGYELAYDVDLYKEILEDAKREYENAEKEYQKAILHPLILT